MCISLCLSICLSIFSLFSVYLCVKSFRDPVLLLLVSVSLCVYGCLWFALSFSFAFHVDTYRYRAASRARCQNNRSLISFSKVRFSPAPPPSDLRWNHLHVSRFNQVCERTFQHFLFLLSLPTLKEKKKIDMLLSLPFFFAFSFSVISSLIQSKTWIVLIMKMVISIRNLLDFSSSSSSSS